MSIYIFLIYSEEGMIDYQKCFIENLKLYRKKLGFSQSYLAELCDVSTGTIGNIECGLTKPSFDLIITLADNLKITPETLFHSSLEKTTTDEFPFSKLQLQKIQKTIIEAVNSAISSLA